MPFLLLALIVVPIVELYVIIQVGEAIGVLWTIALLIGDSILGGWLMRSQGRRAWSHFTGALSQGRVPAKETLDGALVIFGGAFLMTPGFISDLFGFALLAPPTRIAIRKGLMRRFGSGFGAVRMGPFGGAGPFGGGGAFGGGGPFGGPAAGAPRRPRGDADVEGTAVEADPYELPPERG